jgi:hypothetical protein
MSIDGGPPREVSFSGVADVPQIWGGAPPYVDIGLPGPQPHPEHPIALPPGSGIVLPPGVPTHPIWLPIFPAHPIVIPDPPEKPPEAEDWQWRFTQEYGWVLDPPPMAAQPHSVP